MLMYSHAGAAGHSCFSMRWQLLPWVLLSWRDHTRQHNLHYDGKVHGLQKSTEFVGDNSVLSSKVDVALIRVMGVLIVVLRFKSLQVSSLIMTEPGSMSSSKRSLPLREILSRARSIKAELVGTYLCNMLISTIMQLQDNFQPLSLLLMSKKKQICITS